MAGVKASDMRFVGRGFDSCWGTAAQQLWAKFNSISIYFQIVSVKAS